MKRAIHSQRRLPAKLHRAWLTAMGLFAPTGNPRAPTVGPNRWPSPTNRKALFEPLEVRLLLSADVPFAVPSTSDALGQGYDPITPAAILAGIGCSLHQTESSSAMDAPPSASCDPDHASHAVDRFSADTVVVTLGDPPLDDYPGAQQAILDGLAQLRLFADSLDGTGAIGRILPLIGTSIGDAIDIGGTIQAQIVNPIVTYLDNPGLFPTSGDSEGTPNTDGVVAALMSSLGALDPTAVVTGGINAMTDQLLFTVTFRTTKTVSVPIDFNESLAMSDVHFVADANVDLDAALDLGLTFGVNLGSDPITADAFFLHIDHLSGDATVEATNIDLSASVGVVDASIVDGRLSLSASVDVAFADDALTLADLRDSPPAELTTLTSSGSLAATLPLVVSLGGYETTTPMIRVVDANIFDATPLSTPTEHFEELLDIDQMLSRFTSADGLATLLTTLQSQLDTGVFGNSLPLVGDKLRTVANFIARVRGEDANFNGVLDAGEDLNSNGTLDLGIVGALNASPSARMAVIRQAMLDALGSGSGGLGLLDKDFHDAGGDGLSDLVADLDDVGFAVSAGEIQVNVNLKGHIGQSLGFDVGLPGLGLALDAGVSGNVDASLDFNLALGFGAVMSGDTPEFYIETDDNPEITVKALMTTPGLSTHGTLGFLSLDVSDHNQSTSFDATFTVDLLDPDGDGRLLLSDLTSDLSVADVLEATISADAFVSLDLTVDFGDASFPSFMTNFQLEWHFDSTTGFSGGLPKVSFLDARMDLGNFFSKFAGPIVEKVNAVLDPLRPINEFLNTRIPVLSDFSVLVDRLDVDKNGEVSLKDLAKKADAELGSGFDSTLFDNIDRLLGLADSINDFVDPSGDIVIRFGSRTFGGDIRTVAPGDLGKNGVLVGDPPPGTEEQVQDAGALELFRKLAEIGIRIAPFNGEGGALNADAIFDLVLGKSNIDLLTWTPPTVVIGSRSKDIFSASVPIFPGFLDASIGGRLFLTADLAFGYDTAGLEAFKASGFRSFEALADGFYVSDGIEGDVDAPELELTGSIVAGASIGVAGLVKAGVEGDITASISFDLHDANHDGKVRLSEIDHRIDVGDAYGVGPLAVFDIGGRVSAGLSAFFWTGIKIPFDGKITLFEARKELFRGTLLDYNYVFSEPAPGTVPVLGTLDNHTLTLNMTERADSFTVTHRTGDPADPSGETVIVRSGSRQEKFEGVKHIVARAGAGDDVVAIDNSVWATAELYGGDGNDTLLAGGGAATIDGGQGRDVLAGGASRDKIFDTGTVTSTSYVGDGAARVYQTDADDILYGGGDDDELDGGQGMDWLEGGAGADSLHDSGTVGNIFSTTDPVTGVEIATDADDRLYGDSSDPAASTSAADIDTLDGGEGNDALNGGGGDDNLQGGDGDDTFVFVGQWGSESVDDVSGHDTVDLRRVDNSVRVSVSPGGLIIRDDATGSVLEAAHIEGLNTGSGDDHFTLDDSGAPTLDVHAGDGTDTVVGANRNSMWTIDQTDTIRLDTLVFRSTESLIGGAANDHIAFGDGVGLTGQVDGGLGSDTLDYGTYRSSVQSDLARGITTGVAGGLSGGIENVIGGAVADHLIGDASANVLSGLGGDDVIDGGSGNDTISGGSGTNTLSGGADDDLYTFRDDWGVNKVTDVSGDDTVSFAGVIKGLTVQVQDRMLTVTEAASHNVLDAENIDHLFTGSGDDLFVIRDSDAAPLESDAGGGHDTLVGEDIDNLWQIFDGGVVQLQQLTFRNAESVTGGAAADLFVIWPGRCLSGDISGGNGDDTLDYGTFETSIDVDLSKGTATGIGGSVSGIETVFGGDGNDRIVGDDKANRLYGSKGGDVLEGRGGDDTLTGDAGDDHYVFSGAKLGHDVLIEASSGTVNDARDVLDFSALTSGVDVTLDSAPPATAQIVSPLNLTLTLVDAMGFEDVVGSRAFSNTITGNSRNNVLEGGSSNDLLLGLAGDDRYVFKDGWGIDMVTESSNEGNDTFDLSRVTANLLTRISRDNRSVFDGTNLVLPWDDPMENVITGSGNDRFTFGDTSGIVGSLDGGLGIDTLDYADYDNGVMVQLLDGTATGVGGQVIRMENITGSRHPDTLLGDDTANILVGGESSDTIAGLDGDDWLEGSRGDDTIAGGMGNDRYVFAGAGLGHDTLVESSGIPGGPANDALDSLDFRSFAHRVEVNLGASVGQTVGIDDNDLRLTLSGTNVFEALIGSSFDDRLTGNARGNVLEGGQGNDQLTGLSGDDQYVFAGRQLGGDTVIEAGSLVSADNDAHDRLDFSAFAGPVQIDLANGRTQQIKAGDLALYLSNPLGIEDVVSSAFADAIRGNPRNNTYLFQDGWNRDTVTEALKGGIDTFDLSAVTTSIVTTVTDMRVTSGTHSISSVGEKIENVIAGSADDRFEFGTSGVAAGFLDGGLGTDKFNYANYEKGVTLNLLTRTATGVGGAAIAIEDVVGSKTDDDLTGSNGPNRLDGNGGSDRIVGLGGDDTMTVKSAFTFIDGGTGSDMLYFGGLQLDLTRVAGTTLRSVDRLNIRNSQVTALIVDEAALESLAGSPVAPTLLIVADEADVIGDGLLQVDEAPDVWAPLPYETIDQMQFSVYRNTAPGKGTLKITQCRIGDFNCDGRVDMIDFGIIMEVIKKGGPQDALYDLNGNGAVNVADSRMLVTLFDPVLAPQQKSNNASMSKTSAIEVTAMSLTTTPTTVTVYDWPLPTLPIAAGLVHRNVFAGPGLALFGVRGPVVWPTPPMPSAAGATAGSGPARLLSTVSGLQIPTLTKIVDSGFRKN